MRMTTSLGAMIGRALLRKPAKTYCSAMTTLSRRIINRSHSFHRSFNSSPVLHFSGYTNGGINVSTEKDVNTRSITKGDIINLKDLLFTKDRDYLVKSNNEHVKTEHLDGKVIGIYFLPLCIMCSLFGHGYPSLLKDIYKDLKSVNNFEVVMVGYEGCWYNHDDDANPWDYFEEYFSCMPWTAIPFSDKISRERMRSSFGVTDGYPDRTMFVVDPTGLVLQCHAWDIFENFGASGYPFSDERIEILRAEEVAAAKQISLKTLLSSPERDYVISNKGDKVPIQTLEDKVVALYIYNVDISTDSLTEPLKSCYEELKKIKKQFEVVLVYIKESQYEDWDREESFWELFKTMPWLALPFGEKSYKKFREVLELPRMIDCESKIVIIGPRVEFIESYGAHILFRYNISAYPFTREKVAQLDTGKLKELKLEMLWDPMFVFRRNDGSQVSFSQLSGKRVMLILESFGVENNVFKGSRVKYNFGKDSPNTKFLQMLKSSYLQTQGTDDEFEVIRILIPCLEFYTSKSLGDMPNWPEPLGDTPWLISLPDNIGATSWLVSLASDELKHDLSSYFVKAFPYDQWQHYLPIFAFDRDGKLVRETVFPTFEDTEFPFYSGGSEEEKLSELNKLFSAEGF